MIKTMASAAYVLTQWDILILVPADHHRRSHAHVMCMMAITCQAGSLVDSAVQIPMAPNPLAGMP